MKSFEEFLEDISTDAKQYLCTEDEIIYIKCGKDNCLLGKYCPKIEVEDCQYGEDMLVITLDMKVKKKHYGFTVYAKERMNEIIVDIDDSDLLEAYGGGEWINNRYKLLNLIKRYIKLVINDYISTRYWLFARCGWQYVRNRFEYKSVTYRNLFDITNIQDMFGGAKYSSNLENANGLTANSRVFLDFLKRDKALVGIFAYTIHSLVWDYQYRYQLDQYYGAVDFAENTNTVFFSACIYGKRSTKAKIIANILSNLFQQPSRDWGIILHKHHISATAIEDKISNMKYYSSVPIIVTAKSNHILKTTKIVKEFDRKRREGRLFIYPLYISDIPINVDEMVNFEVDNIELPFLLKDKEKIADLHSGALELLFYFLLFLRDLEKNVKADWNTWYFIRDEIHNDITIAIHELGLSIEQDADWLQDNLPIFLLYVALRDFCVYLKKLGLGEDAEHLKRIYKDGFVALYNQIPQKQNRSVSVQTNEYLLCMNKMIKTAIQRKAEWIYVGNEPRGKKERCFYLEESKWYEYFTQMVQKDGLEPISKRKMVNILKQKQLLKTQKTSSANGVKRNGKYYLAILADNFECLIQGSSRN